MSGSKQKPPLALDMEFDEALRRFAQTSPNELKHELDKANRQSQKKDQGA